MNEFFKLLKKFDLKGIFIVPTNDGFLQFFRYAFVGGIAAVVDFAILYIFTEFFNLHHMISAIIAFIGGLCTNFILSKILVFNKKAVKAKVTPIIEFCSYALIGIIGLRNNRINSFSFHRKNWITLYVIKTHCNNSGIILELSSKKTVTLQEYLKYIFVKSLHQSMKAFNFNN